MENSIQDATPAVAEGKISKLHEEVRSALIAGDIARAEVCANEALPAGNDNSDSFYWKGAVLFFQGKYTQAVSFLSDAVNLHEFDVRYFSLLASAYLRSGQAEKANLVADRGLVLKPNDLYLLEVKALALISLFRLQEAHVILPAIQALKEHGIVEEQPTFITDDPEALYEQALTIDPFKTKSRLDNFNTLKMPHAGYRLLRKITLTDRSTALIGFLMLVGLAVAATYFFRDGATYRSFSPLVFMLLWRGMAKENALNAATNLPVFFTGSFRTMLQKYDRSRTLKGIAYYVITFAAFAVWHTQKSWIALVVAFISATLFTLLDESFAPGTGIKTVQYKTTRRKKAPDAPIQFAMAPYESLYGLAVCPGLRRFTQALLKTDLLKYGFRSIAIFPILFLLVWIFADVPYRFLLYCEMIPVILLLFIYTLQPALGLKVFFPAAAREFVPSAHARRSVKIMVVWALLFAVIAAHFVLQNYYMLIALVVIIPLLVLYALLRKQIPENGDPEKKERLIAYLNARLSIEDNRQ